MRKIAAFFKENKKWNIALWVCIGLFLLGSLIALNHTEKNLKVKKIRVKIEPENELFFLDSMAILEIMKGINPNMMLIGSRIGDLKIDEMEADLEANPFVEKADIALNVAGEMQVKILQRSPILRVFNSTGKSYYVAKNGYKIPVNEAYTARVLAANGNIAENLTDSAFVKSSILKDCYKIAAFCSANEFWNAQIEQLYVDNYNDIILIPKVGNHTIVVGSAENIEEKFERLKVFYTKGLNKIGWDKYKLINLKYKDQIVAEKHGNWTPTIDTTTNK